MKFETRSKRRFGNVVERAVNLVRRRNVLSRRDIAAAKIEPTVRATGFPCRRPRRRQERVAEPVLRSVAKTRQRNKLGPQPTILPLQGAAVRRPPGWSPIAPIRRTGRFIHWVHWVYE